MDDAIQQKENPYKFKFEDVDLVLKVTEVSLKYNLVKFIDCDGNQYELTSELKPSQTKGQILKLRCVNIQVLPKEGNLRIISITPRSSCLSILPHFRDAKTFALNDKHLDKKSQYLLDYPNNKDKDFITLTKNGREKLKVTPISKLNKLLFNPDHHINDKFLVEGRIVYFKSTNCNQIISKQVSKALPVVPLQENTQNIRYAIVYHLIAVLADDFLKEEIEFHLLVSEDNYYMFDAWKILPQTKDNAAWNAIKSSDLNKFTKKLNSIVDKRMKAQFVLQLLKTETGKVVLKVVDTMFVDF